MTDPRQRRSRADHDEAVEEAMAVDSLPDEVRTHGDQDETDQVQRNDGAPKPAPDDTEADEEGASDS